MTEEKRQLAAEVIDKVESKVGMGHGAWGMVDPTELLLAFAEELEAVKHKGYLVFTTHDMDEVDAVFIPAGESIITGFKAIKNQKDMELMQGRFAEWQDKFQDPVTGTSAGLLRWHSQTMCQEEWPFQNHTILGTFYIMVY